jgi:hypothetical protein
MHAAILRPAPERLTLVVEQDAKQTPQQDQRGVGHDRWDKAFFFCPVGDELREAVAPDVLVDGDLENSVSMDRGDGRGKGV